VSSKRGIFVAPFDELADPRVLARLAAAAEERGFDGFFVWDHVNYRPPTSALADPWVAMSAIATATERMLIGPLVTPLSRRRIQKVARETVTLDLLSGGRLVFGVGLGSDSGGELEPFGEVVDARERARLLDDGLERLVQFWDGDFEPRPLQRPRIPVWVAARWPNKRPMRRAARWDGLFPIDQEEPEQLAEMVAYVNEHRPDGTGPFEIVVDNPPGTDPEPWEQAGATWCLTGFGATPLEAEVRAAIEAGPG
jgi:alkanesulfonate monooxygenase SsuD/methylene tetrahydromethanopterin reductase-like flavin-dependent oxidoreductase (luciferase family)